MRVQLLNIPILKVAENLFIRGNDVISYETVVAEIQGKQLKMLGKFSRTTSKHISKVAMKLDLSVIDSSEKYDGFYKHEFGVRIQYDNQLSKPLSEEIIESMRKGRSFFEALTVCNPSKKDKPIVENYLEEFGLSKDAIEASRTFGIVIV